MTILFVGGEDHEFGRTGAGGVVTTTTFRRTTYSRCALSVGGTNSTNSGIFTPDLASQSDLWVSAQFYNVGTDVAGAGQATSCFLGFRDGATLKVELRGRCSTTVGTGGFPPEVWVNGTLAYTGTINLGNAAVRRLDARIQYTAGRIQLWSDGSLILDYSGTLTSGGSTGLTSVLLGKPTQFTGTGSFAYWSEVIVATEDTRGFSLATLTPLALGTTQQWSGAVTDINETTLSDATMISTSTADQVEAFTVTPASALASGTNLRAVIVSARGTKGASGPTQEAGVVRVSGTDYAADTKALSSSLALTQHQFTVNPATSAPWTGADVIAAGFNVGVKSIA